MRFPQLRLWIRRGGDFGLWTLLGALAFAQSGAWAPRGPLPVALSEVGTAVVAGKVYVAGGLSLAGVSSTALQIYDPSLDRWTMGPPLPFPGGLDHTNVAAAGGRLYVLGGLQILDGRATERCFEFDPATGAWRERAVMPTARGASGVAEFGGRIYVAGGQRGSITVNEFAAYEPASNTWEVLPPMPTARNHLTAQALGGRFYAIGGRNSLLIGVVEVYNPDTRAWAPRAPMITARSGIASATLRGRIQVLGGETSALPNGTFPQNEEYDPVTDSWQALAPLPTPRHGFYPVALNRRLYAPGGGVRAGLSVSAVNDAFFFPPDRAPQALPAGMVEGAGFRPPLAAGGLTSLFGAALADASAQASRLPLPDSLFEASLLVNGRAVPLLFVSETQINFQMPFDAGGAVTVRLRNAGRDSEPFTVTVGPVAPGIFAGAVLHNSNLQPVTAAAPAARGEALAVFAGGLGPIQPPVEAGREAPASPLSATTLPVTASVGGLPATVIFAGLAPGFAGLYQVNLFVPATASAGSEVPVILTVSGLASNAVHIALR